ncbi:MAG TPA: hypothetical protein VMJ64_14885 [Anaerolineales bacterium]|nr:hypothetical protein [Anaerolineales bacterium]
MLQSELEYHSRTASEKSTGDGPILDLVARLCAALSAEGIDYCHWKSNPFLHRSASGENDLDLLVSRVDAQAFTEILCELGFKEVFAPEEDELPGVENYYGHDESSGRLVHVHAHYQLVLGNDLSKNYVLPVERAYLTSACQQALFRVPAPEFELVVLVIRMVLKHSTWDSLLMRHGRLSKSEKYELECLTAPDVLSKVDVALAALQLVDRKLFDLCLRAVQPHCPLLLKVRAGEQLQKALLACARRPHSVDVMLKLSHRVWQPIQRRLFRYVAKNRPAHGGLFIAIVGGDGAGKTTMLDDLSAWLSGVFSVTRLHMGKPEWSRTTTVVRAILKIGTLLRIYPFEGDVYESSPRAHGYPWFIRAACTARDRFLTYAGARRVSANGQLVLCDRYTLPGFIEMDGPQCPQALEVRGRSSGLLDFLAGREAAYYSRIHLPDLLIVLKVDPEIAVQRKVDETGESVRARSTQVFEADWNKLPAHVIDAGQTREMISSQIRKIVWDHI